MSVHGSVSSCLLVQRSPMNWIPTADERRARYEEQHGDLDERSLVRKGNTACAAGLALLMAGDSEAPAWLGRAAAPRGGGGGAGCCALARELERGRVVGPAGRGAEGVAARARRRGGRRARPLDARARIG